MRLERERQSDPFRYFDPPRPLDQPIPDLNHHGNAKVGYQRNVDAVTQSTIP